MTESHRILTINPGSTSTKVALYDDEYPLFVETVHHPAEEIAAFPRIANQYAFRRDVVLSLLDEKGIRLDSLDAVVGRGGILRSIPSGTYRVNGVAPYAASKGGVTALTHNMAIDYGPTIRVNAIAPGWVLTPLIQSIFDSYPDPAEQQRIVEQQQVMKRIGRPEDIGYAVAFLASDEASFITGVQLFVDGGMTATLESW